MVTNGHTRGLDKVDCPKREGSVGFEVQLYEVNPDAFNLVQSPTHLLELPLIENGFCTVTHMVSDPLQFNASIV